MAKLRREIVRQTAKVVAWLPGRFGASISSVEWETLVLNGRGSTVMAEDGKWGVALAL